MKIIDLEAHFYTHEYVNYLRKRREPPREEVLERNIRSWLGPGVYAPRSFLLEEKLLDLGQKRIQDMDAAGIGMQVLSLSVPGCEQFEPADGTALAKQTNDELAEAVNEVP